MSCEKKIREFGSGVASLIRGEDLSRGQANEMFRQILLDEQPDLQQGAFLAALTVKGETVDEVAGAWEAIYDIDTVKISPEVSCPLVENCGTGMDSLKTFNVSTAAAIVAAAGGVCVARHGARALTSTCGTIDILEELGIDVECDPETVRNSIEKTGIGIFNGMSQLVHPQALYRILSRIRFGTTLNIAGSLAHPCMPRHGARGVYSRELLDPVARVMREIGYSRAIVFHGSSGNCSKGMDEISILGETYIAELRESGDIVNYTVTPEQLGVRLEEGGDISPARGTRTEATRLLRLVCGHDRGPRYRMVCMNAAPIFYIAGLSEDLRDGYLRAQAVIDSGSALNKLREWITIQNRDPDSGLKRLNGLLSSGNIKHPYPQVPLPGQRETSGRPAVSSSSGLHQAVF